jgi:hypothetical protein
MTGRLIPFLRTAAIIAGLSFAFTWFGVYSTGGSFLLRLLMWLITMGVGGATAIWAIPAVFERYLADQHVALRVATAAALIAIPVTASLIIFFLALGGRFSPFGLLIQYLYAYAICLVMVTGGVVLAQARRAPPLGAAEASDARATFLERLPVKYRGAAIWAISSEDHYLRIHTSKGEELILMRLADAMRELAGAGGLQVHRSWWVATDGVADTRREGGKLFLVLKSDKEAPVSRTFLSAVKEANLA